MDTLENCGFNFIEADEMKEFLMVREDLMPLMIKYGEMGFFYVLVENLNTLSNRCFRIFLIGGSDETEREHNRNIYRNYKGPYHTLEACSKYLKINKYII